MEFVLESQIWDLHIHTNECPKGSSEFATKYKNNTKGFVDKLIQILDKSEYSNLSMISFTDHNQISLDVYQEFYSRNHKVTLLPGVEIDYLTDKDPLTPKHLIAYFDVDKTTISNFAQEINILLKDTRDKNNPFKIQDLLLRLYHLKVNFLISPHVHKQKERGLNYDWHDYDFTKKDTKLYMDQFFCFWESSGLSSMSKAQSFLHDFEIENKISIVNFSDSNNFSKLEAYLSNPSQYFHSLPTFKGLALAGSDVSRIRKVSTKLEKNEFSNYIGSVNFNGTQINLSNHLNTIIGGRGSGKSILLDSIALEVGQNSIEEDRKKYISKNSVKVYDFNNNPIGSGFKVDYYQQAYVSNIFNSEDFSERLKDKFKDTFALVQDIDIFNIQTSNKQKYNSENVDNRESTSENLKGMTDSFSLLNNDGLLINIKPSNLKAILKRDDLINYTNTIATIDSDFLKVIPGQINKLPSISKLKDLVKYVTVRESMIYNENLIKERYSLNKFVNSFILFKDNKSQQSKIKSDISASISSKIMYLCQEYVFRNSIVNAILITSKGFKERYCNYKNMDGSRKNCFIFSKELLIQNPIDFFMKCLDKHFDKNKLRKLNLEFKINHFPALANIFIYSPDLYIKESSSVIDLVKEIQNFDLDYKSSSNLYYVEQTGAIKNIKYLSPGYQTNILMEYIVYKDTRIPLLIDQPEDNVDNQTIYTQLKKWFLNLKFKRQVIVVTHDANIVINADAENIILAEQKEEDIFFYTNGALEYKNIIETAANILDGGIQAVQRRLTKYES